VTRILDFAWDHSQAFVCAEEPTADALYALEHLHPFTDMDSHLHALFHELERPVAVVRVQQLEKGIGCVLGAHALMVPCRDEL
jgi:hypothetical protein